MATSQLDHLGLPADTLGATRRKGAHRGPKSSPIPRAVTAGTGALAIALPLSFGLAGSGQAAPTLTVAQAQAQLASLQTQEDQATEAYDSGVLTSQKAARQAQAAGAAVAAQSARLTILQQGIADFAAASYTSGGLNPVESLLAGGDPQVLLDKAAGVNEVARSSDAQLLEITAQRQVLAAAQKTAADQAAAATASLKQLAAAKSHVTAVIAQEQAVLSHMQGPARAAFVAQQTATQGTAAQAVATRAAVTLPPASGVAAAALAAAYSQLGKPYVYGGAGPGAYDCSGLTMWAYARAGVSLPHSAAGQFGYGTRVPASDLQPGDLVFFDEGGRIGHVGIYVGGGKMIDANHSGGWVGVRPLYNGLAGGVRL